MEVNKQYKKRKVERANSRGLNATVVRKEKGRYSSQGSSLAAGDKLVVSGSSGGFVLEVA